MTVFAKLPSFRLLARERAVPISRFVVSHETEDELCDILAGISELKGERGPVGVGEPGKQGEPGVGTAGRRGRRGARGLSPDHNATPVDDGYELRFMQPTGEWGPILYVTDGKVGRQGEVGPPGKGEKGDKGDTGDPPEHQWTGTSLRFRRANGNWGELVNLLGPGGGGGRGRSASQGFDSVSLVGSDLVFSRPNAGPLGPTITVDLSSLGGGGTGDESLTYFLGE